MCYYLFGTLGITVCLHRLLTHRSFACPLWLERTLSVLAAGTSKFAGLLGPSTDATTISPTSERDPHSPELGLFWAHVGWLLVKTSDMQSGRMIARYAKDVMRDPFQAWMERNDNWFKLVVASWAALYGLGLAGGLIAGKSLMESCSSHLAFWSGAVRYGRLRLARRLGRQFDLSSVGLSQLRDAPTTAATTAGRHPGQWRRLAQQSSRRSRLGAAWPQVVTSSTWRGFRSER